AQRLQAVAVVDDLDRQWRAPGGLPVGDGGDGGDHRDRRDGVPGPREAHSPVVHISPWTATQPLRPATRLRPTGHVGTRPAAAVAAASSRRTVSMVRAAW